MSPIISTLTNNWAPTAVEEGWESYYVTRTTQDLNGTTFNGGSLSSGGWGYGGGNCEGLVINVSGSGQYRLKSLSNYKWISTQTGTYNLYIRVDQGTSFNTSNNLVASVTSMTLPSGTGAFEIPLSVPVTLNAGTNYAVGWGFVENYGGTNGNSRSDAGDGLVSSKNFTDPKGVSRTLTLSDITTYNGPDPFDQTNGTSNSGGQLPVFGFEF